MAKRRSSSRRKTRVSTSRYKESYDSRDRGGVSRKSVIDLRAAAEKLGRDIKFFDPNEGANRINIIPYEIRSKNHPEVARGNMEIGDLDYTLDVFVHRRIGEGETDFVCLKRTYGKACPICEEAKRFQDNNQQKEYNALKASRRVFYNVQPVVRGEPSESLFIFHVSHYLFEKELIEEAREMSDGEGIVPFSDIDGGKTVKFRAVEETYGAAKYFEFKSFSFVDREIELDDDVLDEAISFDEFLIVASAEEMEKALFGGGDEDDEEEEDEEPPKRSAKSRRRRDDDEDDEEEEPEEEDDEEEEPEEEEEEDDEDEEDEEPEDMEFPDEEEEEEPPKKKTRSRASSTTTRKSSTRKASSAGTKSKSKSSTAAKKSSSQSSKSRKKKSDDECPHGYRFGVDTDKYDECEECPVWEACDDAKEGKK